MTDRRGFLKLAVGTLVAGAVAPWIAQRVPAAAPGWLAVKPEDLDPNTLVTFTETWDPSGTTYAIETPAMRQVFIPELWAGPGQRAHALFDVGELAWQVAIVQDQHYVGFLLEDLVAVQNDYDLRERYKRMATRALDEQAFFAQLAAIEGPGRPLIVNGRQYVQLLKVHDFVNGWWPRGLHDPIGSWRGRPVYLRQHLFEGNLLYAPA